MTVWSCDDRGACTTRGFSRLGKVSGLGTLPKGENTVVVTAQPPKMVQ